MYASQTCARCNEISVESAIRSPGALTRAIRIVGANVRDGTLRQIALTGNPIGASTSFFLELSEVGPWPDLIDFVFECTECERQFELTAETYHGRGGHWRPLERNSRDAA
jgi:hypothetical protein